MKLAAVLVILAGCTHHAATTPVVAPHVSPESHAFKIGALDAFALRDGALALPNDGKAFALHDPKEVAALLGGGHQIDLSIQPLLVKDGDKTLLFDTGLGDSEPGGGLLVKSLALAGVAPAAVTDIFISHAHGDHVGGLRAFPNATVHISAPEWAAFQDRAKTDADAQAIVTAIAAKVVPFEPGAKLLPEVAAIDTHGHTPGHSSYVIMSNGERLFYTGDVVHSSIISVQQPTWHVQFDQDQGLAATVRHDTLRELAGDKVRVYAVHFPFPGLGHVVGEGDALRWQPE